MGYTRNIRRKNPVPKTLSPKIRAVAKVNLSKKNFGVTLEAL